MFANLLRNCRNTIRGVNLMSIGQKNHASTLTAAVEDDKFVIIRKQAQEELKFPSVWLRDNCLCAECFHHTAKSRRHDWTKFDLNIKVLDIKANPEAKQVKILWSDKHESVYDLSWLQERNFQKERRQQYLNNFYHPKPQLWSGADFDSKVMKFSYNDVIHSDDALQKWLEALAIFGVAIMEDAPIEKTVVRQLANRVGFIRKTTYGEEFIVQSKPGTQNVAYLSEALPLHTDLPYYEYKPGVNILHCMEQTESRGGSNLLADGFYIAERMRKEYPAEFEILTKTLVDWNDIGNDGGDNFHMIWRAPVICLGSDGAYTRINHSVPQRDSHFSVPLEEVLPWYAAYEKFVRLARNDAHAFKTKAGDVLTFNNIRLLHGRTGYDDTESNVRYIVGAYLDWDIIYSKLRVLKSAKITNHNQ